MAKVNKRSTKRRKTKKKKQHNVTALISSTITQLIKWLCYSAAQIIRKNPLIFLGFCLFLCFFSFLAYHMFYNQNMVTRSFFFSESHEKQDNSTSNQLTIEALLKEQSNLHPNTVDNRTPAIPKPRPQVPLTQATENTPSNQAPMALAVPQIKPTPLKDNKPTAILSKEKAQIMRIQTALRNFGNTHLVVNGISDDNTKKAILAFQKMFSLKETGIITPELINKMREIGLLENDTNGLY